MVGKSGKNGPGVENDARTIKYHTHAHTPRLSSNGIGKEKKRHKLWSAHAGLTATRQGKCCARERDGPTITEKARAATT